MKKILIIEDDVQLRENLSEILSLSGYLAITAAEGKTGIEKTLKEKPDLILCDIRMPELDGYGVLHILSRHPDTASVPFIFLTANREIEDLRKGMGMGADDYLIKPFKDSDLLETIEVRLKKSERRNFRLSRTGLTDFINYANSTSDINLTRSGREINKYSKKHMLYRIDQIPRFVYFVVEGKLKEYIINEDGKELIVNIYTKGDFIGYKEVLEDVKYTENVQVIEDAELMLIPRNDFLQLIDNNQEVAREFISLLCRNVREKEERLINLAYNSLRKKVAKAIIQVVDKFKDKREGKPSIEISREDLSHIIGSAPESMIRTLKEFKDEKLIEVLEGFIIVLDEGRLRKLSYQ